MGRIRKALSITSVIATGGAIGTPVKWESSAEKAAREQARLAKEQNELLAQQNRLLAAQATSPPLGEEDSRPTGDRLAELEWKLGIRQTSGRHARPAKPSADDAVESAAYCLNCLNTECDKTATSPVEWTRDESPLRVPGPSPLSVSHRPTAKPGPPRPHRHAGGYPYAGHVPDRLGDQQGGSADRCP